MGNATNTNVLEATNGGLLQLGGTVNNVGGTILASGGTVQVAGAAITGGTLASSGQSAIALQLLSSFPVLSGVTLAPGSLAVVPAGTQIVKATISNGITNNGTILVSAGGTATGALNGGVVSFNDAGMEALSGIGSIVLAPYLTSSKPATLSVGSSCTLTQGSDHLITGAGSIGSVSGSLVNQGLIDANVFGQSLMAASGIGLTNSGGTLEATNGGSLAIQSNVNNTGTILAFGGTVRITGNVAQLSGGTLTGGTWIAQGGSPLLITTGSNITTNQANVVLDGAASTFAKINSLANNQGSFSLLHGQTFSTTGSLTNSGTIDVDAASSLTIAGSYSPLPGSVTIADGKLVYTGTMNVFGTLSGSGTAGGAVSVATGGVLAPGDSPGTITVAGNLLLSDSASYDWEIGDGSFDLTHVTGNLAFGNGETLNVSLYGSSIPPSGDYPLFLVDGAIGTQPNWTINLPAGWTSGGIAQSGNEILLSDLQPVPEPSAIALLAAGIVGMFFRACGKARRK